MPNTILLVLLTLYLPAIAAASETGILELHISAQGKPAAARVYVTGANGRPLTIPGVVTYTRRNEAHSVVSPTIQWPLAPGAYKIRAEKGAEYTGAESSVAITAGKTTRLDLNLGRIYDMNQRGWYSGDLHIHRSPEEMPLLLLAEDLNVGPTITRHVGGPRTSVPPFPATALAPVDATHIVSLQNQEVERLFQGHGAGLFFDAPAPVDPEMSTLWPTDLDFARKARSAGAFVDAEKPIWKNVPVNVALGVVDSMGVVNNHFHPNDVMLDAEKYGSMERDKAEYSTIAGFAQWMIDLYYSFLNCGFRIPVSAGSASGVMPSWPGYERVYVHLSGPFSYAQWFRDLKAGHSIATNGPLLEAYLDGRPPGAEVAWSKPANAKFAIKVHSKGRLDRVEIVFNGDVIRTFRPESERFETVVQIPIPRPGWVAVRCFEPVDATIRYAHSSPFYFTQNGKLPVKASEAKRWAEYVHRLAATVNVGDYPSRQAYDAAQQAFRQAEEVYVRLASGGESVR
jgi:hypothetical protein